jgi:hypothetical protein
MAASAATSVGLRSALDAKGWSYTRLIAEMRRVASCRGDTLPKTESLVVMLSRWLNDREQPSRFYQEILSEALGEQPPALGFPAVPQPAVAAALPAGFVEDGIVALGQLLTDGSTASAALSTAELLAGASWPGARARQAQPGGALPRKIGAELLDSLTMTTEGIRRLDRQLGAANVFDDSARHLQRIARLKDCAMSPGDRRRLAVAAGEVASLAGWQALDLGRPGAAWSYYCVATRAAREAGNRELHTYAVAEMSYVLLFGDQLPQA